MSTSPGSTQTSTAFRGSTDLSYAGFLLREALFWALSSGLSLGVAAGASLWPARRARNAARSRSRKWTVAALASSVAVACAALGLTLPADLAILQVSSYLAAGIGAATGALASRFPRAAGIPLILVAGVLALLGASLVRDLTPIRDHTALASIRVLSMRPELVTAQVTIPALNEPVPRVVRFPAQTLTASVNLIDVPRWLFLLGAYRFAFASVPQEASGAAESALRDRAIAAGLVQTRSVNLEQAGVNLLQIYALWLAQRGDPRFERVDSGAVFASP